MNWEAIGAISEILGVAFILISLFYLAFQVRHNTEAIQGSTVHAITQTQQNELHWQCDISDVFVKAIKTPSELSSSENWKMSGWHFSAFAARQNEFFQFNRGLMAPEVWEASKNIIQMNISMPWVKNWWVTLGKHAFSSEFVEYVDKLLVKSELEFDFTDALKKLEID